MKHDKAIAWSAVKTYAAAAYLTIRPVLWPLSAIIVALLVIAMVTGCV
jgi:hypothetical protein